MPKCFVPGCPNKYRSTIGILISYHRFPKKYQRQWLEAIGRDPTIPISNEVVCSDHFTEEEFEKSEKRRVLKPGVIPSKSFSSRPIEPGSPIRFSNSVIVEQETASPVNLSKRRNEGLFHSSSSSHVKRMKTKSPSSSSANSSVKRRLVKTFHNYSKLPNENSNDERLLNQKNRVLTDRIKFLTNKLKTVQKSNRRKNIKIETLSQIIKKMNKKFSLSEEANLALEASAGGIPSSLIRRIVVNSNMKGKKLTKQKFPPELRSFAMTLQFYSAKAYKYVRETFHLALPAPATISKWLSKIDCSPGFTQPSLECLKIKSEEFTKRFNKPLLCALMLDEMSIKKELVCDRHSQKLWGYTDIGAEIDHSNEQELATEALVLMVVAINDNFKIPIAYFFTNKLPGEEKANIVLEALKQLCHTSCKIISITCDGPSVHFKMMKSLGCQVSDPTNIKNYFMHPVNHHKVFVVFDICHMLKLVRNNWARMGVILDPEGNEIKWKFIELLFKYQEDETLHLANKLKNKHIEWRSVKMKVNVAAQTLSNSVADALTFMSDSLHVEEFKNVSHTVRFIKYIDQLFDILNSRNIFAKRMKMPMKQETCDYWKPFIEEALKYLQNCKTKEGISMYKTKKRTPILGFIVSAKSMINIYETEIVQNKNLNYLLTYKFSQDHLELFFCSVRSRNGWVNNPNCQQFKYTYRRLLMHQTQKDCHGNCIAQDQTNVLTVNSAAETVTISDIQKNRKSEDKPNRELEDLESKISLFLPSALGEYAENIVAYISGFVVTKLEKKIKCFICQRALYLEEFDEFDSTMQFLDFKNKGGLTYCSTDVRKICSKIEKKIQLTWKLCGNILPREDNFIKILLNEVSNFMEDHQLFRSLDNHVFDYSIEDINHKKILIENIVRVYGSIRINSICGKITERVTGVNIRKKFSKLILFKNQ